MSNFVKPVRPTVDDLQMLWDRISASQNGRRALESTMLQLDKDIKDMQRGISDDLKGKGKPFMLSWLTSHWRQRATTKGSPYRSDAFRTDAMGGMLDKVDKLEPVYEEHQLNEEKREGKVSSSASTKVRVYAYFIDKY